MVSIYVSPGSTNRDLGTGGDGSQVLPWAPHPAAEIPALQQEGDGTSNSSAGRGRGNHRPPSPKVRIEAQFAPDFVPNICI